MKIELITVDILDPENQTRKLNAFLSSHPVLAISKQLVQLENRAYWTFCIEYDESTKATLYETDKKPRIDYKEVLSEEEFEVFSRLRDVRKRLSDRDDIPVYTVLTNAQLAEIVQKRIKTREGLKSIKRFGDARIAKFGDDLLECLNNDGENADES